MGGRHVAILLATKSGSGFLDERPRSYDNQTHHDWSLHVSDDGSSDETCAIVGKFAREVTRIVSVRDGPKLGYWQNFMSLARDRNLEADYFAFSDRDDVWHADKLERAPNYLENAQRNSPAMYCSRTELVAESFWRVGYSPLFSRPPTFQNALVQNIGGGNTMVFNILVGRLKSWNDAYVSGFQSLRAHLIAKSIATLDSFVAARKARSAAARLFYLKRSGVYRQTHSSNMAVMLAAALRKL